MQCAVRATKGLKKDWTDGPQNGLSSHLYEPHKTGSIPVFCVFRVIFVGIFVPVHSFLVALHKLPVMLPARVCYVVRMSKKHAIAPIAALHNHLVLER
jgi:hypothetical protein